MPPPSRIGRYPVRRRIGSGGFATVWLAYDDQLDSPVAIKVLADNWSGDADVRRRFVEEGRFLRRVDSPHVVSVHDAGETEDGRPFLVMTYADQGTLADRFGSERPDLPALGVWQGVDVIRQVGMGLAALHRRDVLHRDVKPGNVLFRTDDARPAGWLRAMLGDLGLGKSLDLSSRLTMIAGTPSYVAPEQARGEALDARADQYSLGALTYLVLTGGPPWVHATLASAAEGRRPPPLGSAEQPFPEAVEEVVARALHPDREARWPDVAAYVAALDAAVASSPLPSSPGAPSADSTTMTMPLLTAVGERPSRWPDQASDSSSGSAWERSESGSSGPAGPAGPAPVRGRGRPGRHGRPGRLLVVGALVAALAGGAAAYVVAGRDDPAVRVATADGRLAVEVPRSWRTTVGQGEWTPPGADRDYPALSVGGQDASAPGVFVGLMAAGDEDPVLPGHPECDPARSEVLDAGDGVSSVLDAGCDGGLVVVERVSQVVGRRWLWTQVRAADREQALQVMDSVSGPAVVPTDS